MKHTFVEYLKKLYPDELEQKLYSLPVKITAHYNDSARKNEIINIISKKVLSKEYFEIVLSATNDDFIDEITSILKEYDGERIEYNARVFDLVHKLNLGCLCREYDEDDDDDDCCYEYEDDDEYDEEDFKGDYYLFDDVIEIVLSVDRTKVKELQNRYSDLRLCIEICLDLYGMLSNKDLIEFYNRYSKKILNEKEITEMITHFSSYFNYFADDGVIVNKILFADAFNLDNLLSNSLRSELYFPLDLDLNNINRDELFTEKTVFDNLFKWLKDTQNIDDNAIYGFMKSLQAILVVTNDFDLENLPLEMYNINSKNEKVTEEFYKLVTDMFYNTRNWYNRGFTPNEMAKKNAFFTSPRVKIGANDPCYCGSGKKYKKCCGKIVN